VQIAVSAMSQGAITVLEKPCRDQELWDAICKALTLGNKVQLEKQRRAENRRRYDLLSTDEKKIMELISSGKQNKEIAMELDYALRTVESKRASTMKTLGVQSVAELVSLLVDFEEEDRGRSTQVKSLS